MPDRLAVEIYGQAVSLDYGCIRYGCHRAGTRRGFRRIRATQFRAPAPKDGDPSASVIHDAAGNLYGTAAYGGKTGGGVVYKVDPSGHETVIWSFTGGADGGHPYAGVVRDEGGNLYETTSEGGHGCFITSLGRPMGATRTLACSPTRKATSMGPRSEAEQRALA